MIKHDEGYIKFNIKWEEKAFDLSLYDFQNLNTCHDKLYNIGLIGAYPNLIGFGNISIRATGNKFIISGSATGNIKQLSEKDYSLVTKYDIDENLIHCEGLTKASSESLSHAAVYESNPEIKAVIHIHHLEMWEKYIHNLPTTNKNAEFGTPEIADEMKKLVIQNSGILIMGGHQEGIISYGKSINEAEEIILTYFNKI
ncbi:MAG: class II aldolase/adducin family protein [Bacteroidales bacterium]|nr:class II aldolase/adducin family protein [Bacteroidales bacterium]